MPLPPFPHLTYCRTGNRSVFLDISADRYFCLPARLEEPFQRLASGEGRADGDMPDALRRIGIVDDAGALRAALCSGLAIGDHSLPPSLHQRSFAKAAYAQWRTQARVRRWTFERVVAHERDRRPGRAPRQGEPAEMLASLHASFNRLSGWFGEADRCLARSLAFRALAFRSGVAPTLVLGVKLDPFAAHCWVQSGARVDNDRIERTRLYTPILTI